MNYSKKIKPLFLSKLYYFDGIPETIAKVFRSLVKHKYLSDKLIEIPPIVIGKLSYLKLHNLRIYLLQ